MCSQTPVSNPYLSHSCRSRSITPMWASQREQDSCDPCDPCAKKIFVKFGLFVFKNSERNAANKDPWDRCDPCAEKIFESFALFVFKITRVQAPSERPAANNIRAISEIRVRIKDRVRPACKNIRSIRIIRVQKIQCEIRVPPKNIRVIPKAPLDFFRRFFDMIVAGRRD